MKNAPTTNTKRIAKEISLLEKRFFFVVHDHSIEVFGNDNTIYVFGKLLKFPFSIPEITITNTDLNGKKQTFSVSNDKNTIGCDGKIFLNVTWSHHINLIELIESIELMKHH